MIGKTISHYEIVDKLGEGGMGVVYKARDTRLDRLVALKVLPPEKVADPERKRRFIKEAKAASALNHPNIITVYDVAQDAGVDFIVMEFVPGKTLAQSIATKPCSFGEALRHAVQIADALAAAHAKGIVHRDLKPANLMVTPSGLVKVLDFGLAKLTEAASEGELARTLTTETTAGMVIGTLAYMSPEQAEGKPLDGRSDIFSFGAVLYEMLSGRRAFAGDSGIAVLTSILRDEPAPFAGVPPDLERIVSRCLRKRAQDRYQSAAELKLALEQVRLPGPESHAHVPSIAVLPFTNLSADKENEYFSDGLAEEIINALTQLRGLRVTARTSAFAFRGKEVDIGEIAAKLKVGAVLEGSVRKAGNRIRVTAQLIDVADGYHLWSERYDREMADIFAIQDEIAAAIVQKLRVRLAGGQLLVKRYTENLEAYNLYLEGRHHLMKMTRESLERGKDCYERALAADPRYALAYSGLAAYHQYLGHFHHALPRKSLAGAKAAALKALELDSSLAEAHSVLAAVLGYLDFDWTAAERTHLRALELNPGSPDVHYYYGFHCLLILGRLDESIAEMQRAVELDPLSAHMRTFLGYLFYVNRQFDLALRHYQRAIEIDASQFMSHRLLSTCYLLKGMPDQAVLAAERACQLAGEISDELGNLGGICLLAGKPEKAPLIRQQLDEQLGCGRYVSRLFLACISLASGEIDSAFKWLEQGVEERDLQVTLILKTEPVLDGLRSDPRYHALLRKMNLE